MASSRFHPQLLCPPRASSQDFNSVRKVFSQPASSCNNFVSIDISGFFQVGEWGAANAITD